MGSTAIFLGEVAERTGASAGAAGAVATLAADIRQAGFLVPSWAGHGALGGYGACQCSTGIYGGGAVGGALGYAGMGGFLAAGY